MLNRYSNLKYIARVGVGLDKVDLQECKKRWIKVLNTPGANANAVADLVLAWVLNLSRNLSLGFKFSYSTKPNYFWFKPNKYILYSSKENLYTKGYRKIYDLGYKVLVKNYSLDQVV